MVKANAMTYGVGEVIFAGKYAEVSGSLDSVMLLDLLCEHRFSQRSEKAQSGALVLTVLESPAAMRSM